MPDVELARLPQGFAEAVNAQALADVEPTLRFYDRDHLPPNPTVPYGVVDYTVTEIPWDPTLDRGIPSGTAAVIVTGVGDRRANALWVLDTVRRLIARIRDMQINAPDALYPPEGATAAQRATSRTSSSKEG
jgi:hypothetical protein